MITNLEQQIKALEEENRALKVQADQNKTQQRFLLEFSEGFATYKAGEEFFNALVQYIADQTKLDYVFMGELIEPSPGAFSIKTFALAAFGKIAGNIEYGLPDGPCEQVIRGKLYAYPNQCKITFPKNKTLVQFNVEGYVGYPLFDVKGNAFGLIAVMHEKAIDDAQNVSSLLRIVAKRAEFELERMKHEQELTLTNKHLEAKNLELELKNSELASFTYIASHDLQEPLRKIEAFSSRILDLDIAHISEAGKNYFSRIQNAAGRAQKLINDLLLYSQTNTTDKHFCQVDLNILLKDVEKELHEDIADIKAIITSEPLPNLNLIEFQFHQLFTNLLCNSLKFNNPGITPNIQITHEIVQAEDPKNKNLQNDYHKISITDNGIGFDNEYAEKIFSIFQRLHSKEAFQGTGIGLTICRKIVENHKGFITASGKVNEGATFNIFIPVEQ